MSRVRSATRADVDALAVLRATRRGTLIDARAWAERAAGRTEDGDADYTVFVAEHQQACVGYGVASRFVPPDDAPAHAAPVGFYLAGLMVRPDLRRRGIGAALVAARLRWVAERAAEVFYFADDDNEPTHLLHARLGFVPVTSTFWFPGLSDPEAAMTLYRLALDPAPAAGEEADDDAEDDEPEGVA